MNFLRTTSAFLTLGLLLAAAPATQPVADCCPAPTAAASAVAGKDASSKDAATTNAAALFEKLKTLVGTWNADMEGGPACTFEYTLTGGGTTLVENQTMHGGMMTMYSLDGDRVVMTHYCGAGNQPRMAAAGLAGDKATFAFVDATGMATPDAAHMHSLNVTFAADGSVTEDWQLYAEGKPATVVSIKLKRAV